MARIEKREIATGIAWVEAREAGLYMLCGCPADSVKHLMKRGLIAPVERDGLSYETGPNAILLSDVMIQNGQFSNLAEFPVLQMLYRQGMLIPDHPGNTGCKPLLVGDKEQVEAQMQYIYRGNYGLISAEEITDTGLSPELASELMQLRLKFAFGRIRPTHDLLDRCIVDSEPVEILNGVRIRRRGLNLFDISYRGETVEVDLNLDAGDIYEVPYSLDYRDVERRRFAVIHSGEGDGWDIHRPSMSSILMSEGRIYLIDAGPNIHHSLTALGIGINEIEGIFHTHCHDDHFCGLTTLMRTDRRIPYFATPLVRFSVTKKLAALLTIEESELANFLDFHDLEFDTWNPVDEMEVRPILSPHPVETNIFIFRMQGETGYRSYAHFADIIALQTLREMVAAETGGSGISPEFCARIERDYLTPVDLKKIDIGGGMIHGDAEDFRRDPSTKIVLAHTPFHPTPAQLEIGSVEDFGAVDILLSEEKDYLREAAFDFLQTYFPTVPESDLRTLLPHPVLSYEPESVFLEAGERKEVYLILSGSVEQMLTSSHEKSRLSTGTLIGEGSVLFGQPSPHIYRTAGYIHALLIPGADYIAFVERNDLFEEIRSQREKRDFLHASWLFGESLSYSTQNILAKAMTARQFPAGEEIAYANLFHLNMIVSGRVERFIRDQSFEIMESGDFFGEENAAFDTPSIFHFRALEPTRVYQIPGGALDGIPITRWKLLETFEKKTRLILDSEGDGHSVFQWRDEFSVNIQRMDAHHKRLFTVAYRLYDAVDSQEAKTALEDALDFLIRYSEFHFTEEEQLMRRYGYPDFDTHLKKHQTLLREVVVFRERFRKGEAEIDVEFLEFLKEWVINHVLTEDRKYSSFLNQRGVY